jgi:glucuronoarabinoxylan endo-1,4-beta-xylanase
MHRSACIASVLLAFLATGCVGLSSSPDNDPAPDAGIDAIPVALDLAKRYQTLDGFGASVAWYGETLTSHPDKEAIYPKLFGDLGLDIIRFRNRYQRSHEPAGLDAEIELLDRANQSLGHPPKVLLTSWSPPAALKASGQERCSGDSTCTLINSGGFPYVAFAQFWYDSLAYYAASGIVPDFVSIQNEPDFTPTNWEGCRFDPTEGTYPGYAEALGAVHAKLAGAMSSPPVLIGPETQGIHYNRIESYLGVMDHSLFQAGAHHLYERQVWQIPDDYQTPMNTLRGAQPGLPLFQTEFETTNDNFTGGGFETAWVIHNSLVVEGASAFLYWGLVWPHSGLVSLESDGTYVLRDQYYSMRHYARFTDPGDVRIDATSGTPDIRASAFIAKDQSRVTVVMLNVGAADRTVRLDPGGYTAQSTQVVRTVYRPPTPGSNQWVDLGALGSDRLVALPSRSVATVVLTQ